MKANSAEGNGANEGGIPIRIVTSTPFQGKTRTFKCGVMGTNRRTVELLNVEPSNRGYRIFGFLDFWIPGLED